MAMETDEVTTAESGDLPFALRHAPRQRDPFSAKTASRSDIILGDTNVFNGDSQFSSTMKLDYGAHSSQEQQRESAREAAGKPLGITTAPTCEIHVVFGDREKVQMHTFRSVTSDCYRKPSQEDPLQAYCNDRARKSHPRLKNWEGRNELIMSAAHVGITTRADIPVDAKRFHSFQTTNQEVYHGHATILDSSGPNQPRTSAVVIARAPHNTTNIPLGDRQKHNSYESVAATSFVRHDRESYGATEKAKAPPTGSVLEGDSKYAAFAGSVMFETYQPPSREVLLASRAAAPKERGNSSIAFGESTQSDISRRPTGETVTQRDFQKLPVEAFMEARKASMRDRRNFAGDGLSTGINAAMYPDPTSHRDLKSWMHSPIKLTEVARRVKNGISGDDSPEAAAGTRSSNQQLGSKGRGGEADRKTNPGGPAPRRRSANLMYKTSIVTGDPSRYPMKTFTTTTSQSYQAYPDAEMPTFPVPGANITRSNFSLGDGDAVDSLVTGGECGIYNPLTTLLQSSTAAAFVNHGVIAKREKASPEGQNLMGALNGEYPMSENKTTNSVVYFDHGGGFHRATLMPPKGAAASLLFPIRNQRLYETTNNAYFKLRDGITNNLVAPEQRMTRRNNGSSSIAFVA